MKVFITAGEPSGDALGAALIEGLKERLPDVELRGIAGPRMQTAGMESLFAMDELSVMGIAEVLPKYFHLKRRIRETAEAAVAWQPDVMVTIDSPDFSLRVAALVKAASFIRTVHYVAPTVWAWRPGRAVKMAKVIDHVLALFPFEPPYMEAAGMACDFVGHPVATLPRISEAEKSAFLAKHGLEETSPLVLLPGSRRAETERLMPRFTAAIAQSNLADRPVILPTLPHLAETIKALAEPLPRPPVILTGQGISTEEATHERHVALAAASLALAASGTISLELARAGTPMVIAYDMNWLSRQIIKRKLLIDTVTLVNLVSDTRHIPELIGEDCTPTNIAAALNALEAAPTAQQHALETTMARLGEGGAAPGLRAADAILLRLS
ncbi:MAG: lipid-A-disaccharide synthase [Rhodobacteraceae bacterium]|nr:lipid-A-disaccharide synthase [Paracoccaceae bacterium]